MDDLVLEAFTRTLPAELEKVAAGGLRAGLAAAKALLGRQTGAMGAGAGVGALGGAAVGGVASGLDGYRQAREQGTSGVGSAIAGVSSALGGAGKGALVGAGLGLGAGAASGARGASLAQRLVSGEGTVSSAARFGQRQLHGLTGAIPQGHASTRDAMQSMRGGATTAMDRHAKAFEGLKDSAGATNVAMKGQAAATVEDGSKAISGAADAVAAARKAQGAAGKSWAQAEKGKEYALKAEEMGLTSAPGYLKSLVRNPIDTVRTAVGSEWHGGGTGHKALMFGLPTAMAAGELAAPSQEGGPGRTERALKGLGHLAVPMGVMPLGANLLVGSMASKGLGVVGAGLDARGKRKKPMTAPAPGPEGDGSHSPSVAREYSNAALGRPPEGVG